MSNAVKDSFEHAKIYCPICVSWSFRRQHNVDKYARELEASDRTMPALQSSTDPTNEWR
jgi:hypothetical protein